METFAFFRKISSKPLFVFAFFLLVFASGVSGAKASAGANFLVDSSYDYSGRNSITATDRFIGKNAYFYIDDAYWTNLTAEDQATLLANVSNLANEFDNVIYPAMHQFYGTERMPGIDNDPKIYVLLTDLAKDAGGYYNPNDEYYKTQVKDSRSNEKEIIYLNLDFLGKPELKSFLAHEFQHMINWYQKKILSGIDEEIWLNEALSEYSATLLGYDNPYASSILQIRVKNFLSDPSNSLTQWSNTSQDYAAVSLFMQFLVDHYDKNILKRIVASKKKGIEAINDALQSLNFNTTFSEVFNEWVTANYLNNKILKGGKYAYLNPDLEYNRLHVSLTDSFTVQTNTAITGIEYIKDWSGKWYKFSPSTSALNAQNQTLKIDFNSDDANANFEVPYIIQNKNGTTSFDSLALDSGRKGTAYIANFGASVNSITIMPINKKKLADFTEFEPAVKFSYNISLIEALSSPVINSVNPLVSTTEGGALVTIIGDNFDAGSTVKFAGVSATEIIVSNSKTIIAKAPPATKSGEVKVEVSNSSLSSATAPQLFTYLSLVKDGSLIRAEGDYKVYVVNGKYKRWILSAEIFKFYPHFGWAGVIAVSPQLRDYYQTSSLARADGDYKVYEINTDKTKHHLEMTAEQFSASGRKWDMVYVINKKERDFYKTGAAVMFR